MALRFRESVQDTSSIKPVPSLSMIVPLKGADDVTSSHLNALVESVLDIPVEYLFTMESMYDPAFAVCQKVKEQHLEKDIRVILSGPATGRVGKQHNLAVATQEARYEAMGSMDADVLVEPDILAVGLRSWSNRWIAGSTVLQLLLSTLYGSFGAQYECTFHHRCFVAHEQSNLT